MTVVANAEADASDEACSIPSAVIAFIDATGFAVVGITRSFGVGVGVCVAIGVAISIGGDISVGIAIAVSVTVQSSNGQGCQSQSSSANQLSVLVSKFDRKCVMLQLLSSRPPNDRAGGTATRDTIHIVIATSVERSRRRRIGQHKSAFGINMACDTLAILKIEAVGYRVTMG